MRMKGNSVSDIRIEGIKKKRIEGADYGGAYVGSPGRDIYYILPYLSDNRMEGHRSGDEFIIDNDSDKMDEMEQSYLKGIESADKCNSYKHMFSLYCWASQHFKKFGNGRKRMHYSKKE